MGTIYLVQVKPRWDHSHQVQVRPRYIREYPGPNDTQVRTRVNRSREAQIWVRVIVFQVSPDGDHRNQVQQSPIWEPEQPDPGDVQVGPQLQGPGEAQVATGFTKSR